MAETSRPRSPEEQPFDLRVEREGDVAFVRLTGELSPQCEAQLHALLKRLAGDGVPVRVDLRDVRCSASDGMRILVKNQLKARNGGFDLALIAPSGKIRRLADLMEGDSSTTNGAAAAERASGGLGTDELEPTDWLFGDSLEIDDGTEPQ